MTSAILRQLPGPSPMPAGAYDLAGLGYVEEEFALSGDAASYRLAGQRTADGRWLAEPGSPRLYTTRVLVRRPADGTEFSGTVVVEWMNVSGGIDAPPIWMMTHTHLVRRRHAWVGVTAQQAGLDGGGLVDNGMHLKKLFPDRYAIMSHPGDAWSYDIFSQAGSAVRDGQVLGPLVPRRLLAAGHSQSAAFLTTYLNAVDAQAGVFDGFAVHGRLANGAALDSGRFQPPPGGAGARAVAEQIRADLRVPVIIVQTETDQALLGAGQIAQADSDLLRSWEIAGAAHGDTYLLIASGQDDGSMPAARLAELTRPTCDLPFMGTTELPVNSGLQHHYVACAALEHLDAWAGGGAAPPVSPRLHLTEDGTDFHRDKTGIATGGIRTPWADVPAAVLSGVGQTGTNLFAFLFGVTLPLSPEQTGELYPAGRADYLARFAAALDETITAGFLLPDDRAEALAVASAAWQPSDA
ncbi:MAG TPA: alpha/beta hydrolase domain-containing protein [Streptosporangiaceae bacterium]|nr:alpha/beta hydrolase domain-containing protein [Streptosporangiaceae bacterium]